MRKEALATALMMFGAVGWIGLVPGRCGAG
jgi:hypothetical protein